MFGFLKKKIKETSEKIAEEIEEESKIVSEDDISEDEKEELEKEKKSFFKKLFSKKKKQEEPEEIKSIEEELLEEQEKLEKEVAVAVKKEPKEEPASEEMLNNQRIIGTNKLEKEIIEEEEPEEELVSEEEEEIKKKTTKTEETIEEEITEKKIEEKEPEMLNNQRIIGTNKLEKEKKILGIFKKKKHKEEKIPEPQEELQAPSKPEIEKEAEQKVEEKELKEEKIIDPTQKRKNIFAKLSEKIKRFNITDEKFDELFWELEVVLLENNVAVEVIEKIKENLKQELENTKITRRTINEIILNNLKQTIEELFNYEEYDLLEKIKNAEKPYKILMLGVNGSGKTTTIGKLVKYFQDNNLTSIIAASDTFRAAAIQQIEEHANNLNTKLIKHDYGADPAAVSYDAIEHAKAKNIDVVIIDTAGRLHSNSNLMQELNKIIRVAKPDIKIFIGESITGNDCVEQAKQFNELVGIDGIILTKADVDEKGGAAISISYVTNKPIIFITTGQEYKDLKKFKPQEIIDILFSE